MSVFIPKRRKNSYVATWWDPVTKRFRQKTLGTKNRREAFAIASDMARLILAGVSVDRITWASFCAMYERERLSRRSPSTREGWGTLKRHIADFGEPEAIEDITAAWVSAWQAHLYARGLAVNSVGVYSRYLRAAVNWAKRHDLIERAPYVEIETEVAPRSKATKPHEFKVILAAVPKVRPNDSANWNRLLRGLSRCNLRISELRQLSWDEGAGVHLDVSDVYPLIRFQPKSIKSRKRRVQVVLPEFWDICCETPQGDRQNWIFPLPNGRGGQMSRKRVIRIIGEIGVAAGIVTDPESGKHATSHDIGRRTFIEQIDGLLTMPEAHKAMGHGDFQTTVDYYDTRDAIEIAGKLWNRKL